MRNLRRRVEALEKSRCAQRDVRQGIAKTAMSSLDADNLEQLIGAYGAGRVSRPLTEREAAARRIFIEAVERECRWARTHSIRCDHTADFNEDILHYAAICVLSKSFSPEQLELCRSGLLAAGEGREPNERESAALEAVNSVMARLSQLADAGSAAEFNALHGSVDVAESAHRG